MVLLSVSSICHETTSLSSKRELKESLKNKELPEEVALIRLMGMISVGTNVTNSNWGRLIADAKPFVTTGKPNLKQLKEAKTLVVQEATEKAPVQKFGGVAEEEQEMSAKSFVLDKFNCDGDELVEIAIQQLQAGKLSEEERLMLMHALIGDDPSLPSPNKVGNLDTEESMAYFGQDLDGGGDDYDDRCGF
jgi:hypothetical protein